MATHWQYAESFGETNLQMFENEDLCDITLAAGNEQKQIKCHRFILASRSPVFYAMFCGTLAESKNVICVPDIEPATLKNLLRYLYSGNIEIHAETVLCLLYAAKKYDMPKLESLCMSFLNEGIDTESVCTILDQAILFDDEGLKSKSLDLIMTKSESVLKSNAFVEMSKSGLQEILKLDAFSTSECELYVGCKRWAAQRCRDAGKQATGEQIRRELGDELISLIRFPTMTMDEFNDVVSTENVLNTEELLSVYRSITQNKCVSKCINNPRFGFTRCLFVRCVRVDSPRQRGYLTLWGGRPHVLYFTVSKDCYLTAVDMFLPDSEDSATGVLEVIEGTTVIHSQNIALHYHEGIEHLLVNLDTSIHLHESLKYSVRMQMKGSRGFCCASARNSITMDGLTMTFIDFMSLNDTNVSKGQFYGFELLIKTNEQNTAK